MSSSTESPTEEQDSNPEPEIEFIQQALAEEDLSGEDTQPIQEAMKKPALIETAKVKKRRLEEKAREQRDNAIRFTHAYRTPVLLIVCALILVAGIVSYFLLSQQALRDGATIEAFNFVFFFSVIGSLLTVLYYWQLSRDSLRDRSELADNETIIAHSRQHWMCLAAYVVLFGVSLYGVYLTRLADTNTYFMLPVVLMTIGILLLALSAQLIRLYKFFRNADKFDYLKWIGGGGGGLLVIGAVLLAFGWLDDVGSAVFRFIIGLPPLFVATPSRPIEVTTGFAFVAVIWRWMTWRVNPIVATDTRLVAPSGLLRRRNPSMGLDKITDQDSARNYKLPWVTLELESAGQNQAITKLPWVPRKFLRQIKQPKQEL